MALDVAFCARYIDDFKVEAAHIEPPPGHPGAKDGVGIWEAGPEIWPYVQNVLFADYQVPVVPLEIQMGTTLQRAD